MVHHFKIEDAEKYGLDCAVMLYHLEWWLIKNKANGKNFHDGRYWTYNSISAFNELFPYWSESQIRRILKKLIDSEIVLVGDYNQSSYDKTKWYSLNRQIDVTKSSNGDDEIVKPIPDSKPYSKPYKKKSVKEISVYRKFAHLEITIEEAQNLNENYSWDEINDILDSIENYRNNKKYKSLYLTASKWLKKEFPNRIQKKPSKKDKGSKENPKKWDDSGLKKNDWVVCKHREVGDYLAQFDYYLPTGDPVFKNKQYTQEQLNKMK